MSIFSLFNYIVARIVNFVNVYTKRKRLINIYTNVAALTQNLVVIAAVILAVTLFLLSLKYAPCATGPIT